jgi:hypothetical protein
MRYKHMQASYLLRCEKNAVLMHHANTCSHRQTKYMSLYLLFETYIISDAVVSQNKSNCNKNGI